MSKIGRFEEIRCWQLARELENEIYKHTCKDAFSKDYGLKDQINRSTGSIMDNIAEGFGRGGNREFIQFLLIARASALEVQSQLYRGLDRKYLSEEEFNKTYQKSNTVIMALTSFINYLKKTVYQDYRNRQSTNTEDQE